MLHTMKHTTSEYGSYLSYVKNGLPRTVPIAPAPDKKYSPLNIEADVKKIYNVKSNPYSGAQASSIVRRNARERNRVKQVNDGFNALRKRLPATVVAALSGGSRRGSGKKLSKVDTLKMVVEYIKHLQGLIDESDAAFGNTRVIQDTYEIDEGVYGGRSSRYSDSMPSPAGSDYSSGVSSEYSNKGCYQNYQANGNHMCPMDEDELLDAISWWQEK